MSMASNRWPGDPLPPSETPETNGKVTWLRERAQAPNLATYKRQLLSCADEIESLERRLREAEATIKAVNADLRDTTRELQRRDIAAESKLAQGVVVPREQIMGSLSKLTVGDYVEVRYKDSSGKIKGRVTRLWPPPHAQAQVERGWCFHPGDEIIVHQVVAAEGEKSGS